MATIFYSTSAAQGTISARAAVYNAEVRDSNAFAWLYKKMAYVNASAGGSGLANPVGGGLGNDQSMYTNPGTATDKDGSSKVTRFLPKPHIVSLKTSYAGDMGSTIKCEIAFTVYSLSQLVAAEGFFTVGADMYANWGWANAGGYGGSESFTGKIVNFSWSLNADGGADCTSIGIGKGIDILGANAKLPTAVAAEASVGDITVNATSVISTITVQAAADIEAMEPGSINGNGLGCIEYADDWASSEARVAPVAPAPPPAKPPADAAKDPKRVYVSLFRVIELYNLALNKVSKYNIILRCNGSVTKAHIPEGSFASANPTECIFPGKATYGDKIFDFGADISSDLSKIMINVNWLAKAFESVGKTTGKTDKSPDLSVSGFLKIIFAMIETNSGGAFKLTAAARPEKGQSNIIEIIDAQYIDNSVGITVIPAVTQSSAARSISVSAKIPAELANAAAVTANSGAGVINSAALVKISPFGGGESPAIDDAVLNSALIAIGAQGTSAENVSAVQTALKASIKAHASVSAMYPIDFSFTVDGVAGFIFGNAVTTNYLPGKYVNSSKAVFTVTTVEHNVSGNDWTTTCNTVFRLRP